MDMAAPTLTFVQTYRATAPDASVTMRVVEAPEKDIGQYR
jgi:hypothetical protein